MANFTAKDVQALRKRTGVGMMDCSDALKQSDGDVERAIEILREKGIAKAAKKAGRTAAEGVVFAKVSGKVGAIVEVNSETDFVAKNSDFVDFVNGVLDVILENNPKDVDELKALKDRKSNLTVGELLQNKILSIGENIKIRRFKRFEGTLGCYVHGNGVIGVVVEFETNKPDESEFVECSKNVAMHIAASNPQYLSSSEVPAEVLDKEKSIMRQQVVNAGKPESVAEKIVEGKIGKFYKDVCLLDQPYVKDGSLSVEQYVSNVAKMIGGDIKILSFVRMEKGEGIEKDSGNFAEEISKMLE